MKMAGVPASVVMDFIGHDDAAMSQHYTHVGDSEMRKAADSLPRITI
jgi:site-specific recombinase XerD